MSTGSSTPALEWCRNQEGSCTAFWVQGIGTLHFVAGTGFRGKPEIPQALTLLSSYVGLESPESLALNSSWPEYSFGPGLRTLSLKTWQLLALSWGNQDLVFPLVIHCSLLCFFSLSFPLSPVALLHLYLSILLIGFFVLPVKIPMWTSDIHL